MGSFLFATDYPYDDPGGRMKFKFKDAELSTTNKKRAFSWVRTHLLGSASVVFPKSVE